MITATPADYLQAELGRLDLLLHREILRLRASYQLSLDEFRGLYVSDQQVDNLIKKAAARDPGIPDIAKLTEEAGNIGRTNSEMLSGDMPFWKIGREFDLSSFEQDVLLLAVAPEIDLKYETLYAYLNNDITRKWPTCDLALRIFSDDPGERTSLRRYLLPDAKLFDGGILQWVRPAAERSSSLALGFTLTPSVSRFLLGLPCHHPGLSSVEHRTPSAAWEHIPIPAGIRKELQGVKTIFKDARSFSPPVVIFEGRRGSGRAQAAGALCRDLDKSFFHVDMEKARSAAESPHQFMKLLALLQRLTSAGIYIDNCEALFDKEGNVLPDAYGIGDLIRRMEMPVILACEPGTRWPELTKSNRCLTFRFGDLGAAERMRVWEGALMRQGCEAHEGTLEAIADRFILTPGQILEAAESAMNISLLRDGPTGILKDGTLFEAARFVSGRSLGDLAVRVRRVSSFDDLVLPPVTLRQIKEVAAAVSHRHIVYSQWGFERRIATGKGLKVLFAGSSGTGKTMAAGVIAGTLGLDLYKIDLSGLVSKYIGETEKNLDRIFRAALCSNAILFFDEADALFGKRSEVKDAHDRYANIEVAYLLQKMEDHEGAVILASNLSMNIDEAFSRRMHYVVEFPLPDESYREKLWIGMFPPEAPLGEDVDFRFLARQFSIPGGDIRNVALDAAFLAAADGKVITMKQLVNAMARQMVKQGKIPSATEFKQYYGLLSEA
jgi:Winged helix domain, variant/ATPase family associated with various cellular activities (AAA)